MSLLPEEASFEELVQECFLAHRGQGLMLSALDVELLASWAQEEIPFEVVARGIRRAAERLRYDARAGEAGPRTLRACKRDVEAELTRFRARAAGRPVKPKPPAGLAQVAQARPELAQAVARAQRHVGLDRADRIVAELLRALPFAERIAILRGAKAALLEAPGSWRARRLTLRFQRSVRLSEALNVRGIW